MARGTAAASKSATKSATKPASKSASKPAVKPAVKATTKAATKTVNNTATKTKSQSKGKPARTVKPTPQANIPKQIKPTSLADYLEVMSKAVFQTGVRWAMIDAKWSNFRKNLFDFDVKKIAALTPKQVEELANDPSMFKSPKKFQAVVHNAKTMLELDKEHGGFAKYLTSKKDYVEISKDITKRFKWVGDMNVYYFLFRVGEPVKLPPFDSWITTIEGDHPRMREMVELKYPPKSK